MSVLFRQLAEKPKISLDWLKWQESVYTAIYLIFPRLKKGWGSYKELRSFYLENKTILNLENLTEDNAVYPAKGKRAYYRNNFLKLQMDNLAFKKDKKVQGELNLKNIVLFPPKEEFYKGPLVFKGVCWLIITALVIIITTSLFETEKKSKLAKSAGDQFDQDVAECQARYGELIARVKINKGDTVSKTFNSDVNVVIVSSKPCFLQHGKDAKFAKISYGEKVFCEEKKFTEEYTLSITTDENNTYVAMFKWCSASNNIDSVIREVYFTISSFFGLDHVFGVLKFVFMAILIIIYLALVIVTVWLPIIIMKELKRQRDLKMRFK